MERDPVSKNKNKEMEKQRLLCKVYIVMYLQASVDKILSLLVCKLSKAGTGSSSS